MKKILLIDDDLITNFFNEKIIKNYGNQFEIFVFTNVDEALSFLKENRNNWLPDIIFLDIFMPVKNGWDFLDEFQLEFKNEIEKIKLFMLSTSVYDDDINKSKKYSSVKGYINKPLTKNSIAAIL